MSAIFGILRFDGQPVTEGSLTIMQAAMGGWGPDGARVWRTGPVGLGHLRLYTTPEAAHDSSPIQLAGGQITVTAAGRLDNRAELLRSLGPWDHPHGGIPDTTLIARAYGLWGESCPDRLLGDWAFAAWDASARRLCLARDHHGTTSLYFHRGPRVFCFASSLKALLSLPEVPRRLDEHMLATSLLVLPTEPHATVYRDVHCLAPAHALTVTPEATRSWRYWWLEHTPDVRLPSDSDYADACSSLYTEAVRCRLRADRPVGATLSGGLDSGSVAVLAAHQLATEGKRLPALSAVPEHDAANLVEGVSADETGNIEAVSAFTGTIDVRYCRSESVTPVEGTRRLLDILESPLFHAVNAYWLDDVFRSARQQSLGVLLTGQGGNTTVSWGGQRNDAVRALMRERRWAALWPELASPLADRSAATWRGMVGPLVPMGARRLRQRLLRRDETSPPLLPFVNPDWTHIRERRDRMVRDKRRARPTSGRAARLELIGSGESAAGSIWAELCGAYGLEARDPTWDKRVLEFCTGVPEHQYVRNGQHRWLIRRVMDGRMPDTVLWDPRRGRQAADIGLRVRASYEETRAALEQVKASALARQCLNLPEVESALEDLRRELTPASNDQAARIIMPGLGVGLFLLRF